MKKRWLGYLFFGLVAYFFFLVATVPAGWLAWGITRLTTGAVAIDQVQGSLWHGNGRLIVYYPQATPQNLGQTEWRINPLWLAAARLRIAIKAIGAESEISTIVAVAPSKLIMDNAQISASAHLASELYSPLSLLAPKGRLRLNAKELRLDRDGLHGSAQIFWDRAGSRLSSVHPLGDYRLDVDGAGQTTSFKLATLRGALELTGQGRWQPLGSGMLQMTGVATAKARQQELEPLLRLMGSRQDAERASFRLQTRLRLRLP